LQALRTLQRESVVFPFGGMDWRNSHLQPIRTVSRRAQLGTIGGDSLVANRRQNKGLCVGPYRRGHATICPAWRLVNAPVSLGGVSTFRFLPSSRAKSMSVGQVARLVLLGAINCRMTRYSDPDPSSPSQTGQCPDANGNTST